jgi:hypothetical protein
LLGSLERGKFFELFHSNKQSKSLKGRTKEISDSVNLTMEIVWSGQKNPEELISPVFMTFDPTDLEHHHHS